MQASNEGWSPMQSRRTAPAESSQGPTREHRKNMFTKDEAALKKLTDRSGGMERLEFCGKGLSKEVMASAHEDAGENEAEVPPAHELLRIADVAGNAAVAAALTAANDAAGATAVGAGEDDADALAAALPYGRGVLPAGEDEADAPPV